MHPKAPTSPDRRLVIAALCAVAATPYLVSLGNGLVWDDRMLLEGEVVRGAVSPAQAFTRDYWGLGGVWAGSPGYYRPLTTLSLALDRRLGQGSPVPFHAVNVLFHVAVTLAVLACARRLGASDLEAFLAASLFAVLPNLAETVAWVSGRPDLLCAGLLLGALATGGPASVALGAAALLTKEAAIVWPLLTAVRDRGRWRARLPELGVVAVYLLVRHWVLGRALPPSVFGDLQTGSLAALQALGCLVIPWLTPAVYVPPKGFSDCSEAVYVGAAVLVALGVLALKEPRARKRLALAAVSYAPVFPLMSSQAVLGMRPLYLPAAFLCMALGPLIARAWPKAKAALVFAACGLGIACASASTLWRTDLHYSEEAAKAAPRSVRVLTNLAVAEHQAGLLARAWQTVRRALREAPYEGAYQLEGSLLAEVGCDELAAAGFGSALRANAAFLPAWDSLTRLLLLRGRPVQAKELLEKAVAMGLRPPAFVERLRLAGENPGPDKPLAACAATSVEALLSDPRVLARAALDRLREASVDEADTVSLAATLAGPAAAPAQFARSQALLAKGDATGAVACAKEALRLDPGFTAAHKLLFLSLLRAKQEPRLAEEELSRYLELRPDDPQAGALRAMLGR